MKSWMLFMMIASALPVFSPSPDRLPPLSWQTGHHATLGIQPEAWFPAAAPGAVQLDYARAMGWGSYQFGENWRDYRWMEDVYWTYRARFDRPMLPSGERCFFVSKGIDYAFEIHFNGEKIFEQEGMFKPVEIDLTENLKGVNELKIILFPVPKLPHRPDGRSQAAQSVKPAVSYLWDWHPRLVPTGIWDDTYLEKRPVAHLADVHVAYILAEDLSSAVITLEVAGAQLQGKQFEWTLTNPDGQAALRSKGALESLPGRQFVLPSPKLWSTHDHGNPNRYLSNFTLLDAQGKALHTFSHKIGFRRVQLVMHEGAWEYPSDFPKGRSYPPITMSLNGRTIFAKGTNWVNPEIFPGLINRERYGELLELAQSAHFNLLRVWGGGIVNKEDFYDLCDEMGILVWTEFPLACNNYEDNPSYLAVLRQESEAIIRRVRKHPSQGLWSGGNELFNAWSGMTDQSLALRLLNSQCLLLDPYTPFIPTAPIMGMAHGNYVFRDLVTREEVFEVMPRAKATAYTEFGMPSASPVDLLQLIIPGQELWPPRPGGSWESHHAFNAWVGDTWLQMDLLEEYFGTASDLETLVQHSQWLQAEGYKCIFEEARRQKPICAMALNWCFNEPWITAANNSLVNYPARPKPALAHVANSCRPVLASARLPKFSWNAGDNFSCDLFLLNDTYDKIPGGTMTVRLVACHQSVMLLSWNFPQPSPNKNLAGPTARISLPDWHTDRFEVIAEVVGRPEWTSSYTLQFRSGLAKAGTPGARALNH